MTNQSPYVQRVTNTPPERYASLDGLRGVAAFVVLLWHSFLIASPYLLADTGAGPDIYTAITRTPLKLFFAGTEAVTVFFVLSGFVIILPVLKKHRKFSWLAYYPQRVLRLYIPVAASLFLALGLLLWIPRKPPTIQMHQWLVNTNWEKIDWDKFWSVFTIFNSQGFTINNPLWSIYWEMLFSLLLPLFVYAGILLKRYWYVAILGLLALQTYGYWSSSNPFTYLPLFGLGVVLATHRQGITASLRDLFDKHNQWLIGIPLFALAVFCLIGYDIMPANQQHLARWLHPLSPVGAVGLVLLTMGFPALRSLLRSALPQLLGKISFSLYLVHVPILVAYAYLARNQWQTGLTVGIVTAFIIAIIFYNIIERPSAQIARGVGALISLIPILPSNRYGSLKQQERRQEKKVRKQEPRYTSAP